MANTNSQPANYPGHELVITRLINAPRERVWEAWTNPEHVKQWWGPDGFSNKIVFTAVEKPSLLAYTQSGEDETGQPLFSTTVTFEAKKDRTWLTMRSVFATAEDRDRLGKAAGAEEGGKQTISRLEAFLYTLPESNAFVIDRELNAPLSLVYEVWTDAKHLAAWWGPKGYRIDVKKLEFAPGGIFHYQMLGENGHSMWGRFLFREIVPREKIVFINSFSDPEGNITRAPFGVQFPLEVLITVRFEELGNKTRVMICSGPIHADEEELTVFNGFFESMKTGYGGTLDQLGVYLESFTLKQ